MGGEVSVGYFGGVEDSESDLESEIAKSMLERGSRERLCMPGSSAEQISERKRIFWVVLVSTFHVMGAPTFLEIPIQHAQTSLDLEGKDCLAGSTRQSTGSQKQKAHKALISSEWPVARFMENGCHLQEQGQRYGSK